MSGKSTQSTVSEADGFDGRSKTTTRRRSTVQRRPFLRFLGASAASLSGVGIGTASDGDNGLMVVNVVDDFGADPSGANPSNDAIAAALGDGTRDTKVIFPAGTYWIDGTLSYGDLENVSVVGQGDVRVVPTEGTVGHTLILRGSNVTLQGFIFDYRKPETKCSVFLDCEDGLLLRDISFRGVRDVRTGMNHCFYTQITNPNGTGVVENVHCPDGAREFIRQGGTWVPNVHAGELLFYRCSFERFSDNAIYASGVSNDNFGGQHGAVKVENCFFHNNNIASIRLGSPGSHAKNCTVFIDDEDGGPPALYPNATEGGIVNARAIWLWYDFDGIIENCDVVIDHPNGSGILWYEQENKGLSATVKNTRIEINADAPSASEYAGEPIWLWGIWGRSSGEPLTFENISITGSAPGYKTVRIADRDATFKNCCIHQSGSNRDGIEFENASGVLSNTTVNVTDDPVVTKNASVETHNLRTNGTCPRPVGTDPN